MQKKIAYIMIFTAISLLGAQALAQVELDEKMLKLEGKKDRYFEAGMREYGISGGFGHGEERQSINDLVLLPKIGFFIADFDKVKGAVELELEPVLGMFVTPSNAIETGLNLLFTYNFETGTKLVPYFSAGAGFLYTNLQVHELGSEFNGSPQGGPGLKYMLNDKTAISFQTRFHHISNAGTASHNHGINSWLFLFGVDFYH
ncbi:MAG TPA: acyloxyacyl hydrolase [Candidatus Hypogeohydataceae bacterium YC41]